MACWRRSALRTALFFTPTIAQAGTLGAQASVERPLNVGSKFTRFADLLFERDLLHQVLQLMDRLFRYGRRFSRAATSQRVGPAGEIQVIGFHAARCGIVRRVGVNGDEEISLLFVGDSGARLQWNEVSSSRV